nr:MAG TPA: hypothetical protein [Crassvirales sp.]DAQ98842.1 MAG TPA: hypothetical protein [Crassvirales sp.]
MNKNYNKHKNIAIFILTIVAVGLGACSYNKVSNKPVSIDSCGINDDFYEINDVDSTNDGYDTDSVIYLDGNGNIIKAPLE